MQLDLATQSGPVAVTLAYVTLYYLFQINVLRVKTAQQKAYEARGEKFDRYFGEDREMLAADRVQLNTLEHMPPFLVLLWLNAVFVSPFSASVAGAIYVAARALYPFLLGGRLGRGAPAIIMASTGFGYAVLVWYAGALIWAMTQGS